RGIANDVFKFVPSLTALTFTEKFSNEKAQQKKEEPKEEKPAAEAQKPRKKKAEAPAPTS
ncbi:MAG TPA: hypothetical protein VJR06_00210, partial [Nitrososphaerales archaeon]|nr:hypothetical protein [Nitrososphaerales archaeon]